MDGESTSSDAAWVVGSPGSELGPGESAVMGADFGDLFLIALDAPVCTDVISIDEAILILVGLLTCEACRKGSHDYFPCYIHYFINRMINKII